MDAVINIISSLGFPIAVCIACFWYIREQNKQHTDELDKLRKSIDNNTKAITILIERFTNGKTV